jgi:hypothetical protein
MHSVLQVALPREARQHEHAVGHLRGKLKCSPGYIVGAANLEAILATFRVGAEGHDV